MARQVVTVSDVEQILLTQDEGDARYLGIGYVPPATDLSNYWTKAQADGRYEPLDSAYTKAEADAKYLTQALGDARYQPIGTYLTQAAGDARYPQLTGGSVMTGLLGPTTTNTRDLGTTALRWRKLWAVDGEFTNAPTVGGTALPLASHTHAALYVPLAGGNVLTGSLGPTTTGTRDLGTTGLRWNKLFVADIDSTSSLMVRPGGAGNVAYVTNSLFIKAAPADAQMKSYYNDTGWGYGPGGATATDVWFSRIGANQMMSGDPTWANNWTLAQGNYGFRHGADNYGSMIYAKFGYGGDGNNPRMQFGCNAWFPQFGGGARPAPVKDVSGLASGVIFVEAGGSGGGTDGQVPLVDIIYQDGGWTTGYWTPLKLNNKGKLELSAGSPTADGLITLQPRLSTGNFRSSASFVGLNASELHLNTLSPGGGATDYTNILFGRQGSIYWRIGQNVAGANADNLDIYSDALARNVMTFARATGHVGVGVAPVTIGDGGSPRLLHVHNAGAAAYALLQLTTDQTGTGVTGGAITFGSTGYSGNKRFAQIGSQSEGPGTLDASGRLEFYTASGGALSLKMKLDYLGTLLMTPVAGYQAIVSHSTSQGAITLTTGGGLRFHEPTNNYYAGLISTQGNCVEVYGTTGCSFNPTTAYHNAASLGQSNKAWQTVYAQTGAIQPSHASAKRGFALLDPAACAAAVAETDWLSYEYIPAPAPPADEGEKPSDRMAKLDEYAKRVQETAHVRKQNGYVLGSPDHKVHDLFGLADRASASPSADLAVVACALQDTIARLNTALVRVAHLEAVVAQKGTA